MALILILLVLLGRSHGADQALPAEDPECSGLDPPSDTTARYDTAEEFGSSRR